jgi:hypothetical protein
VVDDAEIVNPLERVSTSLPVVTVTVRAPDDAAGSIFKTAVALVLLFTVSDATVTPAPKLAVVVPCTQLVNWPVSVTESFCCPCWPLFGLTDRITGVPAVIVVRSAATALADPPPDTVAVFVTDDAALLATLTSTAIGG